MNINELKTPEEYQREFNQLVDEHGLPKAIAEFWDTHTSISLKKLGCVLVLMYTARTYLLSIGVSQLNAVVLSMVVVFLTAQVFYRLR